MNALSQTQCATCNVAEMINSCLFTYLYILRFSLNTITIFMKKTDWESVASKKRFARVSFPGKIVFMQYTLFAQAENIS